VAKWKENKLSLETSNQREKKEVHGNSTLVSNNIYKKVDLKTQVPSTIPDNATVSAKRKELLEILPSACESPARLDEIPEDYMEDYRVNSNKRHKSVIYKKSGRKNSLTLFYALIDSKA